jgi:hypothetical protein
LLDRCKDELHRPVSLERAVREIAVIERSDREHPDQVKDDTEYNGERTQPDPYDPEAYEMEDEEWNAPDPVDPLSPIVLFRKSTIENFLRIKMQEENVTMRRMVNGCVVVNSSFLFPYSLLPIGGHRRYRRLNSLIGFLGILGSSIHRRYQRLPINPLPASSASN